MGGVTKANASRTVLESSTTAGDSPVVTKANRSRTALESATVAGDSPVCDTAGPPDRHLSRAQHVKVGPNPRGPSRKAKYSLATDSEPSSASERWEEPL